MEEIAIQIDAVRKKYNKNTARVGFTVKIH